MAPPIPLVIIARLALFLIDPIAPGPETVSDAMGATFSQRWSHINDLASPGTKAIRDVDPVVDWLMVRP